MNRQTLLAVLLVALTAALSLLALPAASDTPSSDSPYPPLAMAVPTSLPYPPPQTSVSPLPTLFPTLAPTATPVVAPGHSREVQQALEYLAHREQIMPKNLVIVNEFRREAPLLRRTFQAITVLDVESGRFFQMLVDLTTGQVEERASIESAEDRQYHVQYGKLQPALFERLQTLGDEELVTVMIWIAAPVAESPTDQQAAAFATLAAKYPQAQEAMGRSGKPMDVDDPALAEHIYDEYVQILNDETTARIQPLVTTLDAQGFVVKMSEGLPAVTATLPKQVVQSLVMRDDVGAIYLVEEKFQRTLNSAIFTNLAPTVWERGYDGNGVDIAILEDDNVDFTSLSGSECPNGDNCFRSAGPTQTGTSGIDWHASLVASVAASAHPTYRGMAPGARIMSAGMQGFEFQDGINALVWALNNGAEVVNVSGGWCAGSTQMSAVDRGFDH